MKNNANLAQARIDRAIKEEGSIITNPPYSLTDEFVKKNR